MILHHLLTASILLLSTGVSQAGNLLRDDFSSADTGWPNMAAARDSDLGFAVYTEGGKYQLTPVKDGVFGFIAAPKQASGGDVKLFAELFLYAGIGAGAGGLACRHQDHNNFYAFTARGDGVVAIIKIKDGVVTPLAQGRVEQVMSGAVDTRMTASCKGDSLSLSFSGGGTLSARDTAFADGKSGVFVLGEKLAGTSVSFDSFALDQL